MLVDPEAVALYTTDGPVLESQVVLRMAQEKGKSIHEFGSDAR